MRRRGRTDGNQTALVKALRQLGASVAILSSLGGGVPDLLVGLSGHDFLFEVKDGSAPRSQQALTPDEEKFHATWKGRPVDVVLSLNDALAVFRRAGLCI